MGDENVIVVRDLTKKFGSFTAVDKVSFEVKKGEIFGFLGANGAGKTTTMRILTGLLHSTSGYAEVAGIDVNRNPEKVKRRIGYMSQRFSLYEDLTIRENITFYGGVYGLPRSVIRNKSDELIAKLGLEEKATSLIKSLPLGWKQKLAFSVAILHDPGIVFLDEPTSGVDPITRRQFWNMIYEAASNGVTVFITTHYLDEAEYCDRVSIMVAGRIGALNTPSGLKKEFHADSINDVFLKLARPDNI